jgi:hypothetical protein
MTTPDTLNPYEQIWQSRDLKALESTPIKLDNKRPEWKKGLNAFVDEMQGTGYGLAALASQGVENVVGPNDITKGITDWGLEGYNRNMEESQAGVNAPKIARVEDAHTASDAMDWASFQLGKGLPMLASLAVPAAIGGTIARFGAKEGVAALAKSAVGDTVKKAVATKALQAAEGDVVTGAMKQAAAKALQDRIAAGAVTGGYLGSFGLEGGQSFGETVGQGVKPEDAVKSAIAVGGINGALEFLPFYSAAKSIGLGQYAKKGIMNIIKNDEGLSKMAVALATAKELGGRAVKGGIVGAGAEGITEGLQELTSIAGERWAKNDPLFADLSEDDWSRVKNSMAAGALTGGVAMGAGATLGGPQKVSTSTDEGQQGGSPAGGITAPPKTREQEIEELRNKINTELEVAVKSGNTVKAEQLASARDKLDVALGGEVVPPVQEAPVQETPAKGQSLQDRINRELETVKGSTARVEELTNTLNTIREDLSQKAKNGEVISQKQEQGLQLLQERINRELGTATNSTVRAKELSNIQEASTQQPPAEEVTPPPPDKPIQMQRGEEIILTPSDPETRVVPTEEEKVRLQELMGARPEKAPVQDVTQPEVVPNAEEVQAQTEAPVVNEPTPPEAPVVKPSIPKFTPADVGKIITFNQGKKDTTVDYANIGKPYEITHVDKSGKKISIRNENGSSTTLDYADLSRHFNDTDGNPFTITESKPQEGGDVKYSMPLAPNMEVGEASMEEFEAIRKQFQERQKQETPFKNWFGKGVKGITANEDNTPITLYHGTNNPDFNQWDSSRAGDASGHPTSGLGFFMTADKGAAARYGNNLMAVHAKIQNPYTLTDADLTSIETKEDANKLRKRLMAKGYDGAVVKAPGAKPYVIAFESKQVKFVTNEKPTDSPDFRYSMPEDNTQNIQEPTQESPTTEQTAVQEEKPLSNEQAPVIRSVTPAEFRANIDSIMGEGWLAQAEAAGIIQVVDGKGTRGEAGSWDGNTFKIYLQSMPVNGSPAGVLLHEGSHAPTFKQILGDNLEGFLSDLDKLAANDNKAAQKAIMHATIASANVLGIKHSLDMSGSKEDFANVQALIEEQKPGLLAEEKLAYFIQYGSETQSGAGFLKRLINAIKAWFAQTQLGQALKAAGIGFELNEGMAVEWAKMSLQRSLYNAQQAAKVREQVVNEAKLMPPSVRLGRALETAYQDDPLYSMGIQEIKDFLATDPTDSRVEMVNKPGLLQRWRADFIDFFAEIEKKSKTVYDAFTLLRNKKAARLAQARQEYYLPLLKEIVGSKWTAKQVGDMLAARHHKVDKVNTQLAERASYEYTKELLKALPKTKRKELMAGRVHIKAGKMPDGSVYMVNGVPATMSAVTKQKLMFDLMNKYSQFEITDANGKQALREEWEIFKDAAGGFSDGGVAKGMVRTVDEVLSPASEDQARFDRIAALFDAMNRHALQIREDGGLITADEHARLLMDKSAYAPLKRESYNVNTETMRLFQQAGRGGSKNLGTRAGTAELSEPTNVLQNALALLEASAAAAERNLANQELYKVVNADKAAWKPWFHIAAKDKYVTHDEDGFLQEKNSTAVNRADIVLIKDGKKIVIRPNMHNERAMGFVRAANNLDAQELSGPMKVLGMFNNLVRAVNITFSPIFLMMNAIKDPLTAAYNLQATEGAKYTGEIFVKDYFKTYRDSFRMLKKVFMDNNRDRTDADIKWVERYENAGGRTSFIEQLKENDNTWRSFDAQVARRQGNFKHLMAVKDTWIDGIENLNILFENVMRFSTFRVLVEKGMSDTDAARIAQDLTTNFSRRGYKSQALGLWWLFFNASVQGNYQVVRNLMKSKRLQTLSLGTIAFAVMLDLLGRAIADDWDEIPEWDKERFIIIPVKVGGDYVKIPAPWVYNTLWRTGGLIGEMFSGVKKPQDALLDIAAMTATTFNPLGNPGSIAQAIAPTAADPFIQILENKDFAGNPIGPEGYPGASKKANSELLWSSTPKGYQSIARFVNEVTGGSATESGGIDLKPGDYQLLAKFLTGSMGRFLTDSTFGFAEDVKKGIEGPKDIPVIREFFSDPYDPLTVQKYHTNIASIYGAHRLEQMYKTGPDRDLIKLQEVRSERGEELRMYSQAQDVERQLKSLRVRLKAAQARDDVGREKQLKERMAQVQEQFNAAYKQRVN